jgi:hypothetical protein
MLRCGRAKRTGFATADPPEQLVAKTTGRAPTMTEYVIKKVSQSLWMVFADRRSICACADENEALRLMAEHSAANNTFDHAILRMTIAPEQNIADRDRLRFFSLAPTRRC